MTKRASLHEDVAPLYAAEFQPPPPPRISVAELALRIWWFAVATLLLPAILAWFVRGTAFAIGCTPGAGQCLAGGTFEGLLGASFQGLLDMAWLVGAVAPVTLGLTLAAGLAAIVAARPIRAALTVLLVPMAALMLPIWLVGVSADPGCHAANTVAHCVLWGRAMSASIARAGPALELTYTYVPLGVAAALVAGLLGCIVAWGCRQMARDDTQ